MPRRCGRCKSPYWHVERKLGRTCGGCGSLYMPTNRSAVCSACFRFAQTTAASIVTRAINLGLLRSLSTCKVACKDCGGRAIHYDHRDYGKPLMVAPVCQTCNCRRGTGKLSVRSYKKIKKNNLKMSKWILGFKSGVKK